MTALPTLLTIVAAGLAALAAPAAAPSLSVAETARSIQPGEVVVLTVTSTAPVTNLRVRAFDRALEAFRVSDRVWRVLIGIDLDVKPGSHVVSVDADTAEGAATASHTLLVRGKAFPTRQLRVAEQYVNPPPTVLKRIEEEAARLNRIWSGSAPERLWTVPFVVPVPQTANSAFGSRSVFNGQPRSPHGGADFPSPARTPVKAPSAGRIVLAGDLYYTGNTVVIDHGLGLVSLFAHLSRIDVKEREMVTAGAVVGLVGATGRVTGPHLHWTVRADGARVDPLSLLAVFSSPDLSPRLDR
jgi:murein DD-endopeptidase MepM/ murein hydrolase activator NlpD